MQVWRVAVHIFIPLVKPQVYHSNFMSTEVCIIINNGLLIDENCSSCEYLFKTNLNFLRKKKYEYFIFIF